MNTTPVAVAMLGVGRIGKMHATLVARSVPETRLVAVGAVGGVGGVQIQKHERQA